MRLQGLPTPLALVASPVPSPTETLVTDTRHQPDHQRGLAAARRRAQWEIGDPSWADMLIDAYFSPDDSDRALTEDGADLAVLTREAAQ